MILYFFRFFFFYSSTSSSSSSIFKKNAFVRPPKKWSIVKTTDKGSRSVEPTKSESEDQTENDFMIKLYYRSLYGGSNGALPEQQGWVYYSDSSKQVAALIWNRSRKIRARQVETRRCCVLWENVEFSFSSLEISTGPNCGC